MKRLCAVIAALLLVVGGGSTPAQADAPYNYEELPLGFNQAHMVINEAGYEAALSSKLVVQPPRAATTDERGDWLHCLRIGPVCDVDDSSKDLTADSILPFCSKSTSEICVERLEVFTESSGWVVGEFIRSARGGVRIEADGRYNLLEGGTPLLFKVPGALSESGMDTYAVNVRLTQHFQHKLGKFTAGNLIANVAPYKEVPGDYEANYFDESADPRFAYRGGGTSAKCIFVEDDLCGARQDFSSSAKVRLTFRMPDSMGGWFSGRMKNPNISISDYSKTATKAIFEASPVEVAKFHYAKNVADISIEKTFNIGRGGSPSGGYWAVTAGGPGGQDVFRFIELFREATRDTAAGSMTIWNAMTTAGSSGSYCLADKSRVLGIVTTNAMGYDTGSPRFENGFLNYKVGGLHFMPDGKTEVQGTYDLVMRSETARCLYGFSKAPISATVSVVGGENNSVATTTVSEKDGWLKMAAYGFTFSQKTIQIKMTQKVAPKKTTITCVKGKVTKKVTASAPKCPTGYKKK